MISPDQYLERIVAGIQAVTMDGADVNWNEKINGRQFDVVVRFKLGTLSYLVVLEVKNKTRKASAAELEGFVTKARDQNANKAVFVTAAGFQGGAIKVAKKHGVDLFTVSLDSSRPYLPKRGTYIALRKKHVPYEPMRTSFSEPTPAERVVDIVLVYANGQEVEIPDEQSAATYYIGKSKLADGRTLHQILQAAEIPKVDEGVIEKLELKINPPQLLTPPDTIAFPAGILTSIRANVVGVMTRLIEGNTLIEPNSFMVPVIYKNVMTGEVSEFDASMLPIGEKKLVAGKFYFQLHPLNYVYCESVEGKSMRLKLVESFQSGKLVRATMSANIRESVRYILVTDKKKIAQLEARLEAYDALSRSPSAVLLRP